MRVKFILFFLIFILLKSNVQAQQAKDSIVDLNFNENWNFRISPFFWYLGFNGEILRPPQPSNFPEYEVPPSYDIDLSFRDINNSIKFFLMLSTKYQNEKFIVSASVTSLVFDGKAITPFELISRGINYKFVYLTSEITGGYRIIKREKINFDGLLGARMLYTKIEASSNIFQREFSGNRSVFWYDPIIGFQFKYLPIKKLEFFIYGDFGPIKSISSYQTLFQSSYFFTKVFSMSLGYRSYFVNSEEEKKETIYTGRIYGPYLRFGLQF